MATDNTRHKSGTRSPWAWIPTLYFAQGLPYVAVMTLSVIMYKRLGISNTDIALYTGWLNLPWVIKPFWSPFVDIISTKRRWTLAMQWVIAAAMAAVAFTIPAPFFFTASLAVFWIIGFTSATHDIAADGFYMLALDSHRQSLYVGIRSTFYRIATVAGQGLLVIIAGLIETSSGAEPLQLNLQVSPDAEWSPVDLTANFPTGENPGADLCFMSTVRPGSVAVTAPRMVGDISFALYKTSILDSLRTLNHLNGFVSDVSAGSRTLSAGEPSGPGAFTRWVRDVFGEKRESSDPVSDNFVVVGLRLNRAPEPGREVVLNMNFRSGDPGIRSEQNLLSPRLTFTSVNWDRTAWIAFEIDHRIDAPATARFNGSSGNIPFAWSVVFGVLSVFFLCVSLYHGRMLPRPETEARRTEENRSARVILSEFAGTFRSFFRKDGVVAAILFMLLYRLPEAQLVKLINPFLLDPIDRGGLGLSTGEVGLVYGTIGIIGLTLGGIIGGIAAARGGLRRWLHPMAWSMSLTCLTFVWLSYNQTASLLTVNICVFVEQFGYGFGFTAFMLYMIYFSRGEHKTSHYAICTGFMALGMMLPGMAAGWLQETIGYRHFFIWTIICCVATVAICHFIKIDPKFGLKGNKD